MSMVVGHLQGVLEVVNEVKGMQHSCCDGIEIGILTDQL